MAQFSFDHPEIYKDWFNNSKYIINLSCKDEQSLITLMQKLDDKDIKYSYFKEPDIDYQVTSITIEPGIVGTKLCSSLPLALKEFNEQNKINKHSLTTTTTTTTTI
jgi:hypothetical protein